MHWIAHKKNGSEEAIDAVEDRDWDGHSLHHNAELCIALL